MDVRPSILWFHTPVLYGALLDQSRCFLAAKIQIYCVQMQRPGTLKVWSCLQNWNMPHLSRSSKIFQLDCGPGRQSWGFVHLDLDLRKPWRAVAVADSHTATVSLALHHENPHPGRGKRDQPLPRSIWRMSFAYGVCLPQKASSQNVFMILLCSSYIWIDIWMLRLWNEKYGFITWVHIWIHYHEDEVKSYHRINI